MLDNTTVKETTSSKPVVLVIVATVYKKGYFEC